MRSFLSSFFRKSTSAINSNTNSTNSNSNISHAIKPLFPVIRNCIIGFASVTLFTEHVASWGTVSGRSMQPTFNHHSPPNTSSSSSSNASSSNHHHSSTTTTLNASSSSPNKKSNNNKQNQQQHYNTFYYDSSQEDIVIYHRFTSRVQRGDVVIFHSPLDKNKMLIKRVIGMPGDSIKNLENSLVNVPSGYCWLEGDNSHHSRDSNWYGPIPMDSLCGVVTHRVYPSMNRVESVIPEGVRSRVLSLSSSSSSSLSASPPLLSPIPSATVLDAPSGFMSAEEPTEVIV